MSLCNYVDVLKFALEKQRLVLLFEHYMFRGRPARKANNLTVICEPTV
jgi:hypothetical protein